MKEKSLKKSFSEKELEKLKPIADKVMELESKYAKMTDNKLHNMTKSFKILLKEGKTLDDILPDAFATIREVSYRLLGKKPYYVQVLGGIALHKGLIAEMKTGEGKTVTETMPVYLNALEGKGVHVVTVNDYLAKRDCEEMGKIYNFLELSVGLISSQIKDIYKKKRAYNCDITYGTNNEFGFDYLRDNIAKDKKAMVQRGHNFAIVDEVDSILIDEARTPLIISGNGEENTKLYKKVADLVRSMSFISVVETESGDMTYEDSDVDYIIHEKKKIVTLTPHGIRKAEEYLEVENLAAPENALLYHMLNQAVKAAGIMINNRDYVVKNGEVLIVDEFTGRIMKGRQFNEGLHQAIEAKEQVEITNENETIASVTFQNYFRMYNKLSGMTGTAMTEQEEFKDIYNLNIVAIPTNKPVQRIDNNDIIYLTEDAKYDAIVEEILERHKTGQPVLVGTPSIEKSELVAKKLKEKADVKFNILNAKNDELEAAIVAQAGRAGAITIATNMAGRGTDICLGGNPDFMAKDTLKKDNHCAEILKKYSGIIQMASDSDEAFEHIKAEMLEQADGFKKTDNPIILDVRRRYNSLNKVFKMSCDAEKKSVQNKGGLFVIGCERHETRRIDNQLIGRAGRQGDEGESQFYISLEDDLMKLFGGEKILSAYKNNNEPTKPLQDTSLEKAVVFAQKNVEGQHFEQRKEVFDYDIIINEQRLAIYNDRRIILETDDVEPFFWNVVKTSLNSEFEHYFANKTISIDKFKEIYGEKICSKDFPYSDEKSLKHCKTPKGVTDELIKYISTFMLKKKEKYSCEEYLKRLKGIFLKTIDFYWKKHLNDIECLRKGIYLMGYGQKDPKIEFKTSSYELFDKMLNEIRKECLKQAFEM